MNYFEKINQFDDIYNVTKNLSKKEKGDLFELLTYYLFKLDPRLNNNLQNIWLYSNIPILIKKNLQLPMKDKGIDLLVQINNDYYAIQCKFRQKYETIITWKEVSTFFGLTFGINNKIKGGFFVTNTYDLCNEVIKSIKVEPIFGDFFDNLPENFFENIVNDLRQKQLISYKNKTPFDYQRTCLMIAQMYFLDYDRGYLEMACGTGKTFTSYLIDKNLMNKKTVIFVPSLYLLSQFYSDWINQSYAENIKINYLLVGSDADIDDEVKYKSNGLILFTDPKQIRKYIGDFFNEKLVVICTYQSADKLAEACKNIIFDLGILDESHKTTGQLNKKFSMMLTDKYLTIRKRLFMTATPKIYKGNFLKEKVVSMDNQKFYGEKIYTFNTGSAIEQKRLVDYQILSIYAKKSDIERDIRKNKLIKINDEFVEGEANYLGTILILLKKIHDGTCHHMICYHNTVKRAKNFRDFLHIVNDLLYQENLFVESLDGSNSMSTRKKFIKGFVKSTKGILCSAKVLNEGINIPIVDGICFVDSRFSTIDIVQCIGRSLRLYNGKNLAHIIVPTFIKNFDDNFDNDVYGNIIQILKAMRSTDNGIIEYFKLRQQGNVQRNICAVEYYNNNNTVDFHKEIDLQKWYDNIETKIWRVVDSFEFMLQQVKKFVEENGIIPTSMSKNKIEQKLGKWCAEQRRKRKCGKLDDTKIKKLEEIDQWFWNHKDIFDRTRNELQNWINKYHRLPSEHSANPIEKKLGIWCAVRRREKRNNKLNDTTIKELEKIDGWFWDKDNNFDLICDEVKIWVNKNNRIPSDKSQDIIEKRLGKWCAHRRQDNKKGLLSAMKIKKLSMINGWYWERYDPFNEMYIKLKKWIAKYNKLPSEKSNNLKEAKLGRWCALQRTKKRNDSLSGNRIKQLEMINGWYWNRTDFFNSKYNELEKWIEKNNKIPSQTSIDVVEAKLGRWCARMRNLRRNKKLDKTKIKRLEKLTGWFW